MVNSCVEISDCRGSRLQGSIFGNSKNIGTLWIMRKGWWCRLLSPSAWRRHGDTRFCAIAPADTIVLDDRRDSPVKLSLSSFVQITSALSITLLFSSSVEIIRC